VSIMAGCSGDFRGFNQREGGSADIAIGGGMRASFDLKTRNYDPSYRLAADSHQRLREGLRRDLVLCFKKCYSNYREIRY
jgi:hypothetical protein